MIRASGADDDVAPYPRLVSRKLRFLVIANSDPAASAAATFYGIALHSFAEENRRGI